MGATGSVATILLRKQDHMRIDENSGSESENGEGAAARALRDAEGTMKLGRGSPCGSCRRAHARSSRTNVSVLSMVAWVAATRERNARCAMSFIHSGAHVPPARLRRPKLLSYTRRRVEGGLALMFGFFQGPVVLASHPRVRVSQILRPHHAHARFLAPPAPPLPLLRSAVRSADFHIAYAE
ncbi:hypothetical protein AB1Y20_003284 [Prymnesium parvum]|uniref:Uncharacterized protein n=2 Tax=Prymnesium parvum TaxID=97485 RepID=A0AB34JAE5_PRYPA